MTELLLAAEAEPSKTLFYLAGGVLVVWAVGLSIVGYSRADFPRRAAESRAVMVISVLLCAFVLAATLITN